MRNNINIYLILINIFLLSCAISNNLTNESSIDKIITSEDVIIPINKDHKISSQNLKISNKHFIFKTFNTSASQLQINGQNIHFENVIFDGNFLEVKGSLIKLLPEAENIKFTKCTFKNIEGKHINGYNRYSNQQYAVGLPASNISVLFDNCTFKNISNENIKKPIIGAGFTGGICIGCDFIDAKTNTKYSEVVIKNCLFENITTKLNPNLRFETANDYNDADGIRTYSSDNKFINLVIGNTIFKNMGKRAIKLSGTRGGTVYDTKIIFSEGKYNALSAIKLSENNTLENILIEAPEKQPIKYAFQSHNARNIKLNNITLKNCQALYNSAPTKLGIINNIEINNIECYNCQGGILNSRPAQEATNIKITNILIENKECKPFYGFENITSHHDENITVKKIQIKNGHLKLSGSNINASDIRIILSNDCKDLFINNRGIFEAFGNNSLKKKKSKNILDGIEIIVSDEIKNLELPKNYLILLYGDNNLYKNINWEWNDTNLKNKLKILGNDNIIDNIQIIKNGMIDIGLKTKKFKNIAISNVKWVRDNTENTNPRIKSTNIRNLKLKKSRFNGFPNNKFIIENTNLIMDKQTNKSLNSEVIKMNSIITIEN